MATVKLWTDAEVEAQPKVKAVFDDIRATRKSDFVNNFWRGLANQPEILERTWNTLKAVMGAPGPLDPLTRELSISPCRSRTAAPIASIRIRRRRGRRG